MRRIKIDDDLIAKLDRMIEVRGYQNRLDVRDRYACHDYFSSVDALRYGIRSEATKKGRTAARPRVAHFRTDN